MSKCYDGGQCGIGGYCKKCPEISKEFIEMKSNSCETCKFWMESHEGKNGTCHRFPPSLDSAYTATLDQSHEGAESDEKCWLHPLTAASNWCGEYAAAKAGIGNSAAFLSSNDGFREVSSTITISYGDDSALDIHVLHTGEGAAIYIDKNKEVGESFPINDKSESEFFISLLQKIHLATYGE